jgi:uncharacterized protein (TIGR02145 family)
MSGKTGTIQPWVQIGDQKWQRRNLDVSTYRNGDIIPYVADATWLSLTTGAWCWYNNDPELGKIYGKLYNWHAVNDSRGLAPTGWHIPAYSELQQLSTFLGASGGGALKQTGTTYWDSPNTGATNSTKFNALPAGQRDASAGAPSLYKGFQTHYWSSTSIDASNAYFITLTANSAGIQNTGSGKVYGFSVRCIKD